MVNVADITLLTSAKNSCHLISALRNVTRKACCFSALLLSYWTRCSRESAFHRVYLQSWHLSKKVFKVTALGRLLFFKRPLANQCIDSNARSKLKNEFFSSSRNPALMKSYENFQLGPIPASCQVHMVVPHGGIIIVSSVRPQELWTSLFGILISGSETLKKCSLPSIY